MRAAVLTALAIPLSMLLTATGMVRARISGNLMSLGAIDFGLIVDGSVIIVENCLRLLAGRQANLGRTLTVEERLEVDFQASRQVRMATAFGEAIIIIVYIPVLALTGVEGKMFHPMALTVILALVSAFILSLTFVPAAVALLLTGRVRERENPLVRWARAAYAPVLAAAADHRRQVVLLGGALVLFSVVLYGRLGQEFVPSLDEHDLAIHAMRIPSVGLTQSTEMRRQVEQTLEAVPEVARVFSKTGTAEMATDPMPPNVSDTFVVLRPRDRWPDPSKGKLALIEEIEGRLRELPGQEYEFTQPIQMRFNELIAGVHGDVAGIWVSEGLNQTGREQGKRRIVAQANVCGRDLGGFVAEAVREGSLIRLRPVLMTALVASLGFVPMAVATGTGSEVQRPLATVVIGRLISSTLLTLVVLPALYRMVERRAAREAKLAR